MHSSLEHARFRFAPSPTGFLHIGGVRTALFNWLLARKYGGKFILRIEDTDLIRSLPEYTQAILDGFRWLGLDWDEGPDVGGDYGPYIQSLRLDLYRKEVFRLIEEKKAYPCFCSVELLEEKKKNAEKEKRQWVYDRTCLDIPPEVAKERMKKESYVIRLKVEPQDVSFEDLIRGKIFFKNYTFDDFIIFKSDGMPVYNFAVIVDDCLMKITHVLRGDDHISNTPRQILICRSLGYTLPSYGHLPMILGSDGLRLSKRHGATSVQQYREEGFLPDAILNFLARLGWSYDDSQEFFTKEELIEKFSLEKISTSSAVFNREKLLWLNAEHMKRLSPVEKYPYCKEYLVSAGFISSKEADEKKDMIIKIIELLGERIKLFSQIVSLADFFFKRPENYEKEAFDKFVAGKGWKPVLTDVIFELKNIENFNFENIEKVFKDIIAKFQLKTGPFMQVIRIALTGRIQSPDLIGSMVILGKEESIIRLENLANLKEV